MFYGERFVIAVDDSDIVFQIEITSKSDLLTKVNASIQSRALSHVDATHMLGYMGFNHSDITQLLHGTKQPEIDVCDVTDIKEEINDVSNDVYTFVDMSATDAEAENYTQIAAFGNSGETNRQTRHFTFSSSESLVRKKHDQLLMSRSNQSTVNKREDESHEENIKLPLKCSLPRHLVKHANNKHSSRTFQCLECNSIYDNVTKLNQHVSITHKHAELYYPCSECDYTCARPQNLKRHIMMKHTGERPFKCHLCDYTCVLAAYLKVHVDIKHNKQRQFVCSYCGFTSQISSNLKAHVMSKHTGEKPYRCEHCSYACAQHGNLKLHVMYKHSNERPFICSMCGYRSVDSISLKKHTLSKHTTAAERPYKCSICGAGYATARGVKRHNTAKHKDVHNS